MTIPLIAMPHWRAPTWERTKYYYDALKTAGARHLVVDGDHLPGAVKGLVLAGGVDVNPALYREKRGPNTDKPNKERDHQELALLEQAVERDIPVLCICRGHQLMNVFFGGSVLQDIEGEGHKWHDDDNLTSRYHDVTVAAGRVAEVYGAGASIRVNSRHHQGVTADRVARELIPTACSADGFVEALESTGNRWVVGVQWHPERPEMRPDADSLWHSFVQAAIAI
jgi:gamma-glutamyl-gamma-aminobutyrate hydrolase PuuD